MSRIEERPVTQKWVVCNNCGNSGIYDSYNAMRSYHGFDITCEVCGKEGCTHNRGCITWFCAEGTTHYHHSKCKLTDELLELHKKYEVEYKRQESADRAHDREYSRDHIV